ncbi:tRNA modification GTPase MnmE [Candidatus Hodgkinia cicadicola]|uniref:tRNA modification GTPase MnmE n=1 Tax=Candidatus Hodgkinia cicadicola TaxID=573658 RepID=A0ABX4MFX0_9HYPH|nr:tRNA modification GTPase MnmE [Candidatus Hodgkinia cicadicola]
MSIKFEELTNNQTLKENKLIYDKQVLNITRNTTIYAVINKLPCAIAIIRLSGDLVLKVLNECIDNLLESDSWKTTTLIQINKPINKCVVRWQPSPDSPTGEDYAELHVFGIQMIINKLTNKFKSMGLELAKKGEFTKRGLNNNKISSKEVIEIASYYGMKIKSFAMEQVKTAFRNVILRLESNNSQNITMEINQLTTNLTELIKTSLRLNNVCIVGNTNVGKSSLFNVLSGRNRAIVDSNSGTTRDVLCSHFKSFNLLDTPGFNQQNVNPKYITNAWSYINNAGVIAFIRDSTCSSEPFLRIKHKAAIVIIESKADLVHVLPKKEGVIWVSAYTMEGIPQINSIFKQLTNKTIITQSQTNALVLLKKSRSIKNLETKIEMLKMANRMLNTDNDDFVNACNITNYLCLGK